jgi:hypothetical protein
LGSGTAGDAVRESLQRYADRGVFGGFSARRGPGRKASFRIAWLTREPVLLTFDPGASSLVFDRLLPDVARASPLLAEVQEFVGSRSARTVPQHRRLDSRRVTARCVYRRRSVSVVLEIKGRHEAYAVQKGVNLVHEIFTLLRASHPEYLWTVFGLPAE